MIVNNYFFDIIPFEVGIIILAGIVMCIVSVINDIREKNKLCKNCQKEIQIK